MATYPNQYSVKIIKKDEPTFGLIGSQATQNAMKNLKGEQFKLWVYLAMNQNGFEFSLSKKACEDWGIKKDSYYRGIEELKNKRYLVELEPGVFEFYTEQQVVQEQGFSKLSYDF